MEFISSEASQSYSKQFKQVWLQLLDKLEIGSKAELIDAFNEFRAELVETIAKQRERELREDRAESERFE